jgi:hypothetical protein
LFGFFGDLLNNMLSFKSLFVIKSPLIAALRNIKTKPWPVGPKKYWNQGIPNYDWRKARGKKVAKIDLPNFNEDRENELTVEEIRTKMKRKGIVPLPDWNERPMLITSSSHIMDPYVPPEGDGKASKLTLEVSLVFFDYS